MSTKQDFLTGFENAFDLFAVMPLYDPNGFIAGISQPIRLSTPQVDGIRQTQISLAEDFKRVALQVRAIANREHGTKR